MPSGQESVVQGLPSSQLGSVGTLSFPSRDTVYLHSLHRYSLAIQKSLRFVGSEVICIYHYRYLKGTLTQPVGLQSTRSAGVSCHRSSSESEYILLLFKSPPCRRSVITVHRNMNASFCCTKDLPCKHSIITNLLEYECILLPIRVAVQAFPSSQFTGV